MDFIRAWKDPEYRASLSEEQRASLPANPVGSVELTDDELSTIEGGVGLHNLGTVPPTAFSCASIHFCLPVEAAGELATTAS